MSVWSVLMTYVYSVLLYPVVWAEGRFGVISRVHLRGGFNIVHLDDGIPVLIDDLVLGKVWDRTFPIGVPFELSDPTGSYYYKFEMRDVGRGIKTCILPIRNKAEFILMKMVFDVVTEFDGHGWRAYKVFLRCSGNYSRTSE